MAKEILFLETKNFKYDPTLAENFKSLGGVRSIKLEELMSEFLNRGESIPYMLTSSTETNSTEIQALLTSATESSCAIYFADAKCIQSEFTQKMIAASISLERSTGVKNYLAKGSTIYSESLFNATNLGAKIDPCFYFTKKAIGTAKAINVWSTLNALLYFALLELPAQGDDGTGERIDIQMGVDNQVLAISVCFDAKKTPLEKLLTHPLLEIPRRAADFFECRGLKENSRFELVLAYSVLEEKVTQVQCAGLCIKSAQESIDPELPYQYKTFQKLGAESGPEKRPNKGFKKKFSENIAKSEPEAAAAAAPAPTPAVAAPAAAAPAAPAPAAAPPPAAKKAVVIPESIPEKDALIKRLAQEIEEIKDPLKRGVITAIKDNETQGLKDNIARLKGEIDAAGVREKELIALADKAVSEKTELQKLAKDLESKLRVAQEGTNSKIVTLEKQLEGIKKQNKDLLKKIDEQKKAA